MQDILTKPCNIGDVAYEVDYDLRHGVITHTVSALYYTERYYDMQDGKRLMAGWNIETDAVDCKGQTWPDHYTVEGWENRITTYEKALEILNIKLNK